MKLGTALTSQDVPRWYPEIIVVKHADYVPILPVTRSLDIGNQFLSQKLSYIGTKVTRVQLHRMLQIHDEKHDDKEALWPSAAHAS